MFTIEGEVDHVHRKLIVDLKHAIEQSNQRSVKSASVRNQSHDQNSQLGAATGLVQLFRRKIKGGQSETAPRWKEKRCHDSSKRIKKEAKRYNSHSRYTFELEKSSLTKMKRKTSSPLKKKARKEQGSLSSSSSSLPIPAKPSIFKMKNDGKDQPEACQAQQEWLKCALPPRILEGIPKIKRRTNLEKAQRKQIKARVHVCTQAHACRFW